MLSQEAIKPKGDWDRRKGRANCSRNIRKTAPDPSGNQDMWNWSKLDYESSVFKSDFGSAKFLEAVWDRAVKKKEQEGLEANMAEC